MILYRHSTNPQQGTQRCRKNCRYQLQNNKAQREDFHFHLNQLGGNDPSDHRRTTRPSQNPEVVPGRLSLPGGLVGLTCLTPRSTSTRFIPCAVCSRTRLGSKSGEPPHVDSKKAARLLVFLVGPMVLWASASWLTRARPSRRDSAIRSAHRAPIHSERACLACGRTTGQMSCALAQEQRRGWAINGGVGKERSYRPLPVLLGGYPRGGAGNLSSPMPSRGIAQGGEECGGGFLDGWESPISAAGRKEAPARIQLPFYQRAMSAGHLVRMISLRRAGDTEA